MTRGWLPLTAGLPGLNGGGAAAAEPPLQQALITLKFYACNVLLLTRLTSRPIIDKHMKYYN